MAVAGLMAAALSAVWASPVRAAQPTAQPTLVSAAATKTVPATLTITAVGDLCFASAPGQLIASKGGKAPFAAVASTLKRADVTLGNLECALSHRGSPVPGKTFTFRADPKAIEGLQAAGFDAVSLANNHARDYGSSALLDTVRYLNAGKIAHAGAGKNYSAAFAPALFRSKDTTVALLSFCQIGPANFAAGKNRAGTAYTLRLKTVTDAVKAARRKAGYVIVSFHWGTEYRYSPPTSRQIEFGRASIRAGADLVLSEHPHVIEGVEFYRKKLIAYSLGNFVFSQGHAPGHDSMMLTIQIGPHGIASVKARPTFIGNSGAPKFATGSNARRILGIIARTSKARGSHVRISGTTAILTP